MRGGGEGEGRTERWRSGREERERGRWEEKEKEGKR